MKKNIFKIINFNVMIFVFLLSLVSGIILLSFDNKLSAKADVEPNGYWKNNASASLQYGSGTEVDPYQIWNAADLAYLSVVAADTESEFNLTDKYFVLKDNIELGEYYWTPIGLDNLRQVVNINFNGGANYYIDGLTIKEDDSGSGYIGLFGYLFLSTITNVRLTNVKIITNGSNTGAVAGFSKDSFFENITVSGKIAHGLSTETKKDGTGGLVGTLDGNFNTFKNCRNFAEVIATSGSFTGGIFGNALIGTVSLEDCKNSGKITGVDYVGGLGSGYSTTNATFKLKSCFNTVQISGNSPQENYFAGLIAYSNNANNNTMEYCYNAGAVNAPNSNYVAGLVALGKFSIENCYNNAAITGDNLVAGLAASGIFEIKGSYNGANGKITALSIGENTIAAGLVARMTSFGKIIQSHNRGTVVSDNGISAAILGVFDVSAGQQPDFVVIKNSYNMGSAESAFIGLNKYEYGVAIENCYNLSTALASHTAKQNVTFRSIYNDIVSFDANALKGLHRNLTAYNAANDETICWGIFNESNGQSFNNGYPYIKSGLVSELTINTNGGVPSGIGDFVQFYVCDLFDEVELIFDSFTKSGHGFIGLSTSINGAVIEWENPLRPAFVCTTANPVLYVQYSLSDYIAVVWVNDAPSALAGLFEADGTTPALTIGLETDKILIAEERDGSDNLFSYWAVKYNNNLYRISSNRRCELNQIFNEDILLNHTDQITCYFVAVYEQSWEIFIELAAGDNLSMGELEITIGGNTSIISDTIFRVVKNKSGDDVIPTTVQITLTAKNFYKIDNFGVSGLNDISGNTTATVPVGNDFVLTCQVSLMSDLKIVIDFIANTYYFDITSVYNDEGENYNPTPDDLILMGRNIGFGINMQVPTGGIVASTANLRGYTFVGFKFKKVGGGYSSYFTQTLGNINSFVVSPSFLNDYFDLNHETIYVIAIYEKQYQLNIFLDNTNADFGKLNVKVNNNTILSYTDKFFDINSLVNIEILLNPHCEISSITIITNTTQSATLNEIGNLVLTKDTTVVITMQKVKYYIDLYSVDHNFDYLTSEVENLFIDVAKTDINGKYIDFGYKPYFRNNQYLEYSGYMKFDSWYILNSDGSWQDLPYGYDEETDTIFFNTTITSDNLSAAKIEERGSLKYITIVARIINICVLDINISSDNKLRGSYKIEVFDEEKNDFVAVEENQTEFDINQLIRITATAFKYFNFISFEDMYENVINADIGNRFAYTFAINKSQTISLYFEASIVDIDIIENIKKDVKGKLKISTSAENKDKIKIGDSIVIAFAPDPTYQTKDFIINGKTKDEVAKMFNARITEDSIIINVTSKFLTWIEDNGGKLKVTVSTMTSQLLMIIIIALGILIPLMVLVITIMMMRQAARRRAALKVQAMQDTTRRGFEFTSVLSNATKGKDDEEGGQQ